MITFILDYIPHSQTGAVYSSDVDGSPWQIVRFCNISSCLGAKYSSSSYYGHHDVQIVPCCSGIVTYLYICERERLIAENDDDDHDNGEYVQSRTYSSSTASRQGFE
jgi:hypothetical protein